MDHDHSARDAAIGSLVRVSAQLQDALKTFTSIGPKSTDLGDLLHFHREKFSKAEFSAIFWARQLRNTLNHEDNDVPLNDIIHAKVVFERALNSVRAWP